MGTVRVILLREVKGLGAMGDMKNVKGGYARNFLLPKGLAVLATPENLKRYEDLKKTHQAKAQRLKDAAEAIAARLSELTVEVSLLVGKEGKAFGSVKASDILERLAEAGVDLEKGALHLENPIRALGEYTVEVRLGPDFTAPLKVRVVPKE